MKTICYILAVLASSFALAGCASAAHAADDDTIDVNGMVYDMDGEGVRGADVTLGDSEARTDSQGRFTVPGMGPGTMILKAEKAGYEGITQQLELREGAEVVYVKIASAAQILRAAESAVAILDWPRARRECDRVFALERENPVAAFLSGIVALRGHESGTERERAIEQLMAASGKGYRSAHLWLLIADLRTAMGEKEKALAALSEAYAVSSDPELGARIEGMKIE